MPPEASWRLKKWDYNDVEVTGEAPGPPPEDAEFRDLETGPYGNRVGETVPTYTPVAPPVPPTPPAPREAQQILNERYEVIRRALTVPGIRIIFETKYIGEARIEGRRHGTVVWGSIMQAGWRAGNGRSLREFRFDIYREEAPWPRFAGVWEFRPEGRAGGRENGYGKIVSFDFDRGRIV